MNSIAEDAKQLLEDLSLFKAPVHPVEVCAKLGIVYNEKPYEGFDGLVLCRGDRQLIGVSSRITDPGRKAFTCAHELGHCQYDLTAAPGFRCTRDDVGYGKAVLDEREVRANEFASCLLMPKDLFLPRIAGADPSWELLRELAKEFKTSLQATANRFIKLTDHTCWLVVVKDGALRRYTRADHNEIPIQLRQSFRPPEKEPTAWKETLADSWLYPSRKTANRRLLYWPLRENQYGECPVLLWDRDNTLMSDEYQHDEFDDELDRRDDEPRYRRRW